MPYLFEGQPCRVVKDEGDGYPVVQLANGKLQTVHVSELVEVEN